MYSDRSYLSLSSHVHCLRKQWRCVSLFLLKKKKIRVSSSSLSRPFNEDLRVMGAILPVILIWSEACITSLQKNKKFSLAFFLRSMYLQSGTIN